MAFMACVWWMAMDVSVCVHDLPQHSGPQIHLIRLLRVFRFFFFGSELPAMSFAVRHHFAGDYGYAAIPLNP